ncbi:exonuclease II Exo2, partial [Coemansia sp. RSA 1722]
MENDQPAGPHSNAADADADTFDLERIIDDYVLIIMLVGNDFLPTLPKLSINGGALNFMFATYSRIRPTLGGYLHDNGVLNLDRFEKFMREVSRVEVDSFKLEVADHQWYQIYKHKALLRGETPSDSCIVPDTSAKKSKRGKRSRGKGASETEAMSENDMFEYAPMLGEVTIPIKGGKLVISKSQQSMLDIIRRFAARALPKVAADRHKVQMQYLPGPATPLDNLIVSKAAELLELYVGHEYSHNGAMTLHVAAGSPKAIAKLELEDNESTGDDSSVSSTIDFVGGSTAYDVLGGLEDSDDEGSEGVDDAAGGKAGSEQKSVAPEFAKAVADPADDAAVSAYINKQLSEFDDVLVVPDTQIDVYTRKGDTSDFWQRFELWKANYYRSKLEITYQVPDIASENNNSDSSAPCSGQVFRTPPSSVEPMSRHYIKSLQWVLMYYFQGCQSWSWFYPFHYAPCISDVCANLAAYKVEKFNNDPPYTPYEQLMCVLPPYSRKLLPAPLRALMVDVHSPIRDLFPTTFETDMNGKKMPWEAVVLINFVDIERVRAAMSPKLTLLSEDETRRNSRGKNMCYSYVPLDVDEEDSQELPEYRAPSCLKFPPICPLKCKGMLFVMPTLKAKDGHGPLRLVCGLIEGSVTRARMRPGFPSLFSTSHTAKLAFNATEVFGIPSKDESMLVTLQPDSLSQMGSANAMSAELLNGKRIRGTYRPRRVFVAWPYLRDAVLVGVSDEKGVYTINASGKDIVYREHKSPVERGIWMKTQLDSVFQAKKMQAVILNDSPKVLLHVLHLHGMKLYPNGSLVREYGFPSPGRQGAAGHPWADVDSWASLGVKTYHPSMVLTDLAGAWANNPRFAEHTATPLEQSLPIASRVFFIGRTPLYGHPGKIAGHVKDESGDVIGVDIQLVANSNIGAAKYENFLGVNTLAHRHHAGGERYRPSYQVAREVGISPLLLSRISSRIALIDTTNSRDSSRLFIGLDLKFEAKRLKVIGYTKRGPNGWLFSDRAVDLISRYIAEFPDMFAYLNRNPNKDAITTVECFAPTQAPDATNGANAKKIVAERIERLKSWHKANINNNLMIKVPIESELLSKGEIDAVVAAQGQ